MEELGSGVAKLYHYVPLYANGARPTIQEGDIFCTTIPYSDTPSEENSPEGGNVNPPNTDLKDTDGLLNPQGGHLNPQEGKINLNNTNTEDSQGLTNNSDKNLKDTNGLLNQQGGNVNPQGGNVNPQGGNVNPQGGNVNPQGVHFIDPTNVATKEYILAAIINQSGLNSRQIAEMTGKSKRIVLKHIQTLKQKGIIEFRGSCKTGGYYPRSKP